MSIEDRCLNKISSNKTKKEKIPGIKEPPKKRKDKTNKNEHSDDQEVIIQVTESSCYCDGCLDGFD